MTLEPGLYIISTPIGNLNDITLRAIETLKKSDIILCEDTRISGKLLAKHDIKSRLAVYNDHSDSEIRKTVCDMIEQGLIVSLISDAGTPLISDPGYKLIRELETGGFHIDVIPGVSAPIAALTLSGLPSDRFLFAGFLPKTLERRKKIFEEFASTKATLIFFESAKRLVDSLEDAHIVYGNRQACVARELTKLYQEVKLEELSRLIEFYRANPARGEVVFLISGEEAALDAETLFEKLTQYLKNHLKDGLSTKDATEKALTRFSSYYSKKEIYKIANNMKSNL
jgi:16S rRNA (cytidine1402-2'-O)-methyltransferase